MLKVRKIDRKLKACHNPLLDPESDIFKQQAAAAQKQVKEDRESKVRLCTMHQAFVWDSFASVRSDMMNAEAFLDVVCDSITGWSAVWSITTKLVNTDCSHTSLCCCRTGECC